MQKCYFATFSEYKNVSNSVENIRETFCDVKVKKKLEAEPITKTTMPIVNRKTGLTYDNGSDMNA